MPWRSVRRHFVVKIEAHYVRQGEVFGTSLVIGNRVGRLAAAASLRTQARSTATLPQQRGASLHHTIDLEEIIVLDCGSIRDELGFIP